MSGNDDSSITDEDPDRSYAGLLCTGYMDPSLINLFMMPSFRYLILTLRLPSSQDLLSEDEAKSLRLVEEVKKMFQHLNQHTRTPTPYDTADFIDACADCIHLEFDIRQPNDASEFATKFLDKLSAALKCFAPDASNSLDHAFAFSQVKRKICKTCSIVTSRSEHCLIVDVPSRGMNGISESLAYACEEEIMEEEIEPIVTIARHPLTLFSKRALQIFLS